MKILNKLTLKNLKLNKSRTLVTIVGIMLSAALITVVAGIASSGRQSMIEARINSSGDYELLIRGDLNTDNVNKIQANRNVQKVYRVNDVGVAKIESPKSKYRPYVAVSGIEKSAFEDCFRCSLAQGRYPQSTDELVLAPSFFENSDKEYKVGDTITLNLGSRRQISSEDGQQYIPASSYISSYNSSQIDEILTEEFTKIYKIVGILESLNGDIAFYSGSASAQAFTSADFSGNSQCAAYAEESIYVDYTPEGEKDYMKTSSELLNLDEDTISRYINCDLDSEGYNRVIRTLEFGGIKASYFDINSTLLKYKGFGIGDETMNMLYTIAFIVIAIIIISSIFVIRNSFAISITEKTKLYGMISSVGATPKQIRNNVFFEGFVLALIGIPLGIGLGIGVTAGLVQMLNLLLSQFIGSVFVYSISPIAIVLAVVLSSLTIFFSALATALRASRIAPVEAIRSNRDIKISKKHKVKNYKPPKIITKLFGVGGSIAWKNLKRSKKKYRTTVISIVVSVATFISIFSFVDYTLNYSGRYFQDMPYNLTVNLYSGDTKEKEEAYNSMASLDGVQDYAYSLSNYNYEFDVDKNILSKDYKNYIKPNNEETVRIAYQISAFDDAEYKKLIKELGYTYDEVKNKGILINSFTLPANDDGTFENIKVIDSPKGITLNGSIIPENEEFVQKEYKDISIEIAGELPLDYEKRNDVNSIISHLSDNSIIVSIQWYEEHVTPEFDDTQMLINADDADAIELSVRDMDLKDVQINNLESQARMMNSMVLAIEIFVYGFIIVISLIGITNIFNTITTNMKLRQKEFAMMRSVGMTKREFNRMIRLESLFYGLKSLIIGIPLGLLGGYLINWAFNISKVKINYVFPWLAVLISVVAVFLVIRLIMSFSISKVRKQNIIETIRNDNI